MRYRHPRVALRGRYGSGGGIVRRAARQKNVQSWVDYAECGVRGGGRNGLLPPLNCQRLLLSRRGLQPDQFRYHCTNTVRYAAEALPDSPKKGRWIPELHDAALEQFLERRQPVVFRREPNCITHQLRRPPWPSYRRLFTLHWLSPRAFVGSG